jgi:hypothetical protein
LSVEVPPDNQGLDGESGGESVGGVSSIRTLFALTLVMEECVPDLDRVDTYVTVLILLVADHYSNDIIEYTEDKLATTTSEEKQSLLQGSAPIRFKQD